MMHQLSVYVKTLASIINSAFLLKRFAELAYLLTEWMKLSVYVKSLASIIINFSSEEVCRIGKSPYC